MSNEVFKESWNVDYWHPGHPIYDHYHSKSFIEERQKGQTRIKDEWDKWLFENNGVNIDLSELENPVVSASQVV